jgi:hypothetical protein
VIKWEQELSHLHICIKQPTEIIPRLGKPELHWKKGRSAYELSTSWIGAGDFPPSVRAVLDKAPEWRDAKFLEGIFERETELGSSGKPSQTDLLVIAGLSNQNGIIGIEGKVDEKFWTLVGDRLSDEKSGGRMERLSRLCSTLNVDAGSVTHLYYQLFHRTCAAIYEAKRFRYPTAAMLVHSFDSKSAWFEEFAAFASAVGMPVTETNAISPTKICDGIATRLGWVSDKPS